MLPKSKLMMLDSLYFKGFNTAIEISNQALLLQNVSFNHCILPVKNSFNFPDQQMVNAGFPKLNALKTNSLKATEPKNGAK